MTSHDLYLNVALSPLAPPTHTNLTHLKLFIWVFLLCKKASCTHFSISRRLIMYLYQLHFHLPKLKKNFLSSHLDNGFLLNRIDFDIWKTEILVITASNSSYETEKDVIRKKSCLYFISSLCNSPEDKQLRCVNSSEQCKVISQFSEALKINSRSRIDFGSTTTLSRIVLRKVTIILSRIWKRLYKEN